ncbi:hypothetical protein B0T18DRAFT_392967 [Schizothecium vesticola]|uniref:Uncharacterized protein n=1 Tax=Schizothecium vesticola TaxID=314040 RepID=A0AA40EIV2_9PEZI|nr:hypothetical protein B0T18DRAFT_392967 [Schizothecium vesticola]
MPGLDQKVSNKRAEGSDNPATINDEPAEANDKPAETNDSALRAAISQIQSSISLLRPMTSTLRAATSRAWVPYILRADLGAVTYKAPPFSPLVQAHDPADLPPVGEPKKPQVFEVELVAISFGWSYTSAKNKSRALIEYNHDERQKTSWRYEFCNMMAACEKVLPQDLPHRLPSEMAALMALESSTSPRPRCLSGISIGEGFDIPLHQPCREDPDRCETWSPTCTASCGKLCTGFFCVSNPTGNPNAPSSSGQAPNAPSSSGQAPNAPSSSGQAPTPTPTLSGGGNGSGGGGSPCSAQAPQKTILPPAGTGCQKDVDCADFQCGACEWAGCLQFSLASGLTCQCLPTRDRTGTGCSVDYDCAGARCPANQWPRCLKFTLTPATCQCMDMSAQIPAGTACGATYDCAHYLCPQGRHPGCVTFSLGAGPTCQCMPN